MDGWLTASLTTVCVRHALQIGYWWRQVHHCVSLSSILNRQYLRHSGKEFEGSSDRYRSSSVLYADYSVLCQYFLLTFLASRSLRSGSNCGTINVHALVTIRWFVMQLRWYVPGIGIFTLNGPSSRKFKDENVSVYLIKKKDSNLSCSSKYPPHLWTFFVYNISSDHFIILPIYLMLVRKVTDLLSNQGACVAFPAICYKLSAVLYSPGL